MTSVLCWSRAGGRCNLTLVVSSRQLTSSVDFSILSLLGQRSVCVYVCEQVCVEIKTHPAIRTIAATELFWHWALFGDWNHLPSYWIYPTDWLYALRIIFLICLFELLLGQVSVFFFLASPYFGAVFNPFPYAFQHSEMIKYLQNMHRANLHPSLTSQTLTKLHAVDFAS